ncbi:MAG: NIP7 pre-PUA domain-containing protein [Candidatus Helarchaeota archaeon]
MIIREIHDAERLRMQEIVKKQFKKDLTNLLEQDDVLLVREGKWKEVYLTSRCLLEFLENIRNDNVPRHVGIRIGRFRRDSFRFDVESLDVIARLSMPRVVLLEKGEQTALYGRNIPKSGIKTPLPELNKNAFVLLENEQGDVLGLGKMLKDPKSFMAALPKEIMIEVILDRGWYIRKGH